MSTEYKLLEKDGWSVYAEESSGRISIGIFQEYAPGDSTCTASTNPVFETADLISAVVALASVATYVADDDLEAIAQLRKAFAEDDWLRRVVLP